jgi:molecular chaperone DnaJ
VSHYELLGVPSDATPDEIRSAYRRAARRHHPDADGGDDRAMAAVNEAWHTLGDPGRRLDYDRQLRAERISTTADRAPTPPTTEVFVPAAPAATPKIPWRLMGLMAAVGIGIVLVGVFTYEAPTPLGPDNLIQSGSCVDIGAASEAFEVSCDGPHQGVVEQLVPFDGVCRPPAVGHRDRQGMGVACVRFDAGGGPP